MPFSLMIAHRPLNCTVIKRAFKYCPSLSRLFLVSLTLLAASKVYALGPITQAVIESGEVESASSQAVENTEPSDLGLGDFVRADQWSGQWLEKLNSQLEAFGLSNSWWGQAIVSLGIALVFFIALFILKRFLRGLIRRANGQSRFVRVPHQRMHFYFAVIALALNLAAVAVYVISLGGIWGFAGEDSAVYGFALESFQFIATFSFLFVLGASAFELANGVLEFNLSRWRRSNNARVNTLLPIAKNFINILLFVVLGITLISELGIDVMPLLAGAGVIGFAIGFGAQTLIKDLITGFIIIFEDLVQVGDVVTVGEKTGLVEKITIRKIQLRTLEGTVITVPFSEISIVSNLTKEFSYYMMNIGIAYRESPDEAIAVIKKIGAQMQQDDDYKDWILEPIEVLGVDAFADSAVIIKARIKTRPIKQWVVGREFNRRLKYRFDEVGIEIPFPHQTIYFGEDKQGNSPPAHIHLRKSANEVSVSTTSVD